MVAVALSILLFFRRTGGRTATSSAGPTGSRTAWHGLDRIPDAEELPGIVVFRWEAPLFFANAGMFREQVRQLVREQPPRWILLAVRGRSPTST